jgi:hypothetical protein
VLELCIGCGPLGACRLGIASAQRRGKSAEYQLSCPVEYQGAPGIAPGWWTAACADEVIGRLPILLGHLAVTTQLSIDFARPIPVGIALAAVVSGSGTDDTWTVAGTIARADTGQVLARVSGTCQGADLWSARDRVGELPQT